MKKPLLFLLVFMTSWAVAQEKVAVPSHLRSVKVTGVCKQAIKETNNLLQQVNHYVAANYDYGTETQIGMTVYDLQSNSGSPSGRTYLHSDGSMAAVWTRGMNPTSYSERGTGYNYYDFTAWGPEPTARIESQRTGWPGYAPLGPNGEIVIAHHNTAGLVVSKRANKGSSSPWTQTILEGPAGVEDISWPRTVTSGVTHDTVHVIASTYAPYQGQNLALLYYRSNDQGATWDIEHYIDPSMNSSNYIGFGGDSYVLAEPYENNIAFLMADSQCDLFVMRSSDAGETWQKTIVWEHPYPMLNVATTATDTLYAPDGASHLAFDADGKLHVVFGVYRVIFYGDNTYSYWPGLSGIAYWNEDMPTFTGGDQMNILNPDSLDAQGKLIGYYWVDWDGNGELNYNSAGDDWYGNYGIGWASMPQIAFDEDHNAVLVFSSLIENLDNGAQQYRHMWARASSDNAQTWGQIVDLTGDPVHMFDECVFPCIAQKGDGDYWYFSYQYDNEPGLAIRGDEDPPGDNFINFFSVSTLLNEVKELGKPGGLSVSSPYPNPFGNTTQIDLEMYLPAKVSYSVSNLTGKQMMSSDLGYLAAGRNQITISRAGLTTGMYLLKVQIGDQFFVNKLIVK